MYLSAERLAAANKAVQETFEETSVAWQAIPHWDTGDPGQTRVRSDVTSSPPDQDTFGADSLRVKTETVRFYVTVAQACAPTPDALLAAVMPRTVELARTVDYELSEPFVATPSRSLESSERQCMSRSSWTRSSMRG